jgi:hypothetical protein
MLVWERGLIQLHNAKIVTNYVIFIFTKKMKVNYIFTSYICDFFKLYN